MTTRATNKNRNWNYELSLKQLLADPLVRTLMAADHVDPRELRERLSSKAHDLPEAETATRAGGFFAAAECCC